MMHWFNNYGYSMGHGFGGLFMVLFWVVIIILFFYLIKNLTRQGGDKGAGKSAEEILKERYARGEISKDEYEHMKKEISS